MLHRQRLNSPFLYESLLGELGMCKNKSEDVVPLVPGVNEPGQYSWYTGREYCPVVGGFGLRRAPVA